MREGILVCVSGFSGVGKGTIMNELLKRYSHYELSISVTTREPRSGEAEGVSYFFKTKHEFESMILNYEFLEYACYAGNYYGTPKAYVEEKLNEGKDVILEIEVQGALKVKKEFPDTVLVFVVAPSIGEIRERLIKRGTESEEKVDFRMAQILREFREVPKYDYLLVNEDIDESVETFNNIVLNEHRKIKNNRDILVKLEKEAEEILK